MYCSCIHGTLCRNGNENHELGTGYFAHTGIISAVKRAEFVSGRKEATRKTKGYVRG
jgi:hypothetical protein